MEIPYPEIVYMVLGNKIHTFGSISLPLLLWIDYIPIQIALRYVLTTGSRHSNNFIYRTEFKTAKITLYESVVLINTNIWLKSRGMMNSYSKARVANQLPWRFL